ncbi:hypothetical protein DXA64_04510 [Collinsella sp. OF03-4AA]|nr:hypothetical protein DXA64_04510 [Collinsella sp. OF03-4AA]
MTAYGSRLERFAAWCEREDIDAFAADVRTIRRYLAELSREQVAPRTLAAHLSAIRSLYRWMAAEGVVEGDAVSAIASPKLPRDLPGVLTTKQVEALLKTPDTSTPAGLRDAAMLELLYASAPVSLSSQHSMWSPLRGPNARCACGARGAKNVSSLCIVVRSRRRVSILRRGGRSCSLRQSVVTPLPGRIRCLYRRAVIA